MPEYLPYSPAVETVEPDEQETFQKIFDTMREGMQITREKYGKTPRISHAKAHALLKGTLTVDAGLPPELAQGLFAKPGTYDVLVRMATSPGEYTDDSKLSTGGRGMSIKVLGVEGEKLPGHDFATQDIMLETGKSFFTGGPKAFLQSFKPNALLATRMGDTAKGIVSDVARVTGGALQAIGITSQKLDFFGHPKVHPLAECYFSQTPLRYGQYVCKWNAEPTTPGLEALKGKELDLETPDALRDLMVQFFRDRAVEFTLGVQLCTNTDAMPIEDAQAEWPEDQSAYRPVGRLTIPSQVAFDAAKEGYYEDLSYSPLHSLAAHRPLGGINRARLAVYDRLAHLRIRENGKAEEHPTSLESVPN